MISNRSIPLHKMPSETTYKDEISRGLSLERWAYINNSKKKDEIMTKYIHLFDQFREQPVSNPEVQSRPSMNLLDSYFKRKQLSKLKEIIKIPAQSTEEGVSSLGFEGINFQTCRNRRTVQGFYKGKEAQLERINTNLLPEKRSLRNDKFRAKQRLRR